MMKQNLTTYLPRISGELRAEVRGVRDSFGRRESDAGGDGGQDRGRLQEERGLAEGEWNTTRSLQFELFRPESSWG